MGFGLEINFDVMNNLYFFDIRIYFILNFIFSIIVDDNFDIVEEML